MHYTISLSIQRAASKFLKDLGDKIASEAAKNTVNHSSNIDICNYYINRLMFVKDGAKAAQEQAERLKQEAMKFKESVDAMKVGLCERRLQSFNMSITLNFSSCMCTVLSIIFLQFV